MFSGQNKHSERGSWGEIPRACATVFLAIYFTGLGLTVACNTSSGSSLLLSVVKGKLFSFWLVPPWLDLGFDYFLTYGQQADATRYLDEGDVFSRKVLARMVQLDIAREEDGSYHGQG